MPLAMLLKDSGSSITSPLQFLLASGVIFVAVLFICFGFAVKGDVPTKPMTVVGSDFKDCFEGNIEDHLVDVNTKVVLMVIDAWRLSFLADPDSPMPFLRSSIESGRGVAFATTVQTPTVTMPRIKALTTGMIPSFISLVTNFFATANTDDNWVTSAASIGKKIVFFGDDTWLRLFPEAFTVSDGVTSFFVNDFTEVDNNVTRHLDSKLKDSDWDVLILHYLGLDHIGHSLGGDSPELNRKLREMDNIAMRIFEAVSKRSPVLLVVMADHGMTSAGSHGGGSEAEARVPMVFLHSRVQIKRGGNLHALPMAQQVDLASTMPFFLITKIPSGSLGLSLIPRMAEHWNLADSTVFSAAVLSATHLSKFMEDRSLQRLRQVDGATRCQEAKAYATYVKSSQAAKINRQAQQEIINSQEQVLGWPVYLGLVLIVLGFMALSALPTHDPLFLKSVGLVSYDHIGYLVFFLYHLSSYSTSLVEEEHDIWYYTSSTVILLHLLFTIRSQKAIASYQFCHDPKFRAGIALVSLHRLGMAFTAHTRRRWSMRQDLLPPPIVPEFQSYLRIVDYFVANLSPALLSRWSPFITTTICVCYVLRRIQPKASSRLQASVPYTLSVLICWRVISGIEHGWLVYLILTGVVATIIVSSPLGTMLYLCYLVRPETIPLLVISFEMGWIISRFAPSPNLYAILCQTVFFYQGQSSNISSIDIAMGYKGLSSYTAAFVGFQIVVNFYAAPFALTIGFLEALNDSGYRDYIPLLRATLQLRSVILFSSLAAIISLSGHLFMFSVLAPKLICELLHIIVVLLLASSLSISCVIRHFMS